MSDILKKLEAKFENQASSAESVQIDEVLDEQLDSIAAAWPHLNKHASGHLNIGTVKTT